jgi:CopG family nickel-responsive transcriptional regulator
MMSEMVRFSVSLEADLLARFDEFCETRQLATRSEAIRQLFRQALTARAWENEEGEAAATLTLVYDHHRAGLVDQLMEAQHAHAGLVVSTLHVHLDGDRCLEVIVLRGPAAHVRDLAARIGGMKGIHHVGLVVARMAGESPHSHSHVHTHHSHGHDH